MNNLIQSSCQPLSSTIPKIFKTATKLSSSWPGESSLILPYNHHLTLQPPKSSFSPPTNPSKDEELIKPMTTNFILNPSAQKLLLLQRRADANPFPGLWSAVSGRLDFFSAPGVAADDLGEWESPLMGAVREIKEEIGVQIEDQRFELVAARQPVEIRTTGVVWLVWVLLWRMREWGKEGLRIRLNGENVDWEFVDVERAKGRQGLVPGLDKSFEEICSEWKNDGN